MRKFSLSRLSAAALAVLSLGAFNAPGVQVRAPNAPTAPASASKDIATGVSERTLRFLTSSKRKRARMSGPGNARSDKGYLNGRGDWCTPKRDTKRWLAAHGVRGKSVRQFRKMQQRRFSSLTVPSYFRWAVKRAAHFMLRGLPTSGA